MKARTKGLIAAGAALLVAAAVAVVVLLVLPRLNANASQEDKASEEQTSQEQAASQSTVVLVGTVRLQTSAESASVVADGTGVVEKVLVSDGQEVKEGDVLYTVQKTVEAGNDEAVTAAQSRLAAAQADYADAQAYYDSVMDSYDWAYSNYEEAHAQWEFEHDLWLMQMYAYDEAVADAEWRRENDPDDWDEYGNPVAYIYYEWPGEEPVEPVLASELGAAQARADEWVSSAAYEVEAAQAQLSEAMASSSTKTETHEVKASIAGKISSLRVQEGQALSAEDSEPLLTVEAVSEAQVEATVEEGSGDDLTLGSQVTVAFPQVEGLELPAMVKSVSASKVELALVGMDDRVKDGMEARATIAVQKVEERKDGEADEPQETEPEPTTEVDVSHIDYDVAAMADDEAFQFMHDFTNRTPDEHATDFGKVLRIKGQVSRNAKIEDGQEHVSYSIGVKGEGGTIWVVNFYVEGWEPDDYPQNKATAEVTGVYGEVEGYGTNAGKTLICNASDVKDLS